MRLHAKPAKDKTAGLIRLGIGWMLMLSMALVPGNRALYAPDGAEALAADTPRQHKVIAYVQDMAGLSLREEDAPYLDQVNYAFALLKDGKAHGDHWKSVMWLRITCSATRTSRVLSALAAGAQRAFLTLHLRPRAARRLPGACCS